MTTRELLAAIESELGVALGRWQVGYDLLSWAENWPASQVAVAREELEQRVRETERRADRIREEDPDSFAAVRLVDEAAQARRHHQSVELRLLDDVTALAARFVGRSGNWGKHQRTAMTSRTRNEVAPPISSAALAGLAWVHQQYASGAWR